MNANSTTENVHRCALIHMIATTVPVVTAISWRRTLTPAQVSCVDVIEHPWFLN